MSGQSRTWRVQWWAASGVYHLHVTSCSVAKAERSSALDAWDGTRGVPRTRAGTLRQAQSRGLARCGECSKMERDHEDTDAPVPAPPTRPVQQHGAEPGRLPDPYFASPTQSLRGGFVERLVSDAERRRDAEERVRRRYAGE